MSPVVNLLITFFLGGLGVHKFIQKKYGMGVLYIFTAGLFGIGWLVDVIRAIPPCFAPKAAPPTKRPADEAPSSAKHEEPAVPASSPHAGALVLKSMDLIRNCEKCFIAFDLETTGLSSYTDRIIEISAVRFENLKPTGSFSTLINPQRPLSPDITRLTGITNQMLHGAPLEQEALKGFAEFIGPDALDGTTPLVAHNGVRFDSRFLLAAFSRCGLDAEFAILDTLTWSNDLVPDVENHKLGTLAEHFGIVQEEAHRAEDDARVCGQIFIRMLELRREYLTQLFSSITPAEQDFCRWVQQTLAAAEEDTQLLTFHSSNYLSASCCWTFLKARPTAKKPFVLLSSEIPLPDTLETGPATKSEGADKIRVFFQTVQDLRPLEPVIVKLYQDAYKSTMEYFSTSDRHAKEYARSVESQISI